MSLAVFVIAVVLVVKIVPVFMDKVNFEDEILQVTTRAGAEAWGERMVRDHIQSLAREYRFELSPEGVSVDTSARGLAVRRLLVTVDYSRKVEFPGFVHTFEFETEATAFIGRLK